MYSEWKDKPVQIDLTQLWEQLGVRSTSNGVELVGPAPLAQVREAIMGSRVK
jgi:hypothetical protein